MAFVGSAAAAAVQQQKTLSIARPLQERWWLLYIVCVYISVMCARWKQLCCCVLLNIVHCTAAPLLLKLANCSVVAVVVVVVTASLISLLLTHLTLGNETAFYLFVSTF